MKTEDKRFLVAGIGVVVLGIAAIHQSLFVDPAQQAKISELSRARDEQAGEINELRQTAAQVEQLAKELRTEVEKLTAELAGRTDAPAAPQTAERVANAGSDLLLEKGQSYCLSPDGATIGEGISTVIGTQRMICRNSEWVPDEEGGR